MKKMRDGGLSNSRTIFLTGVLLAVSGFVVLASVDSHGLRSFAGLQDTSPPTASIDPDGPDFGKRVIGAWSPAKRITVTNTGGQPLFVDSVAVEGDQSENFAVSRDTCTGNKVAPYRACIIDISFRPSSTVRFEAELRLLDNAPDSPQMLRLKGDGINSINVPPFLE